MSEALGAASGEWTRNRFGYRASYYSRGLVTRIGKLDLRVPRDREGQFSTEWFARYRLSGGSLRRRFAPRIEPVDLEARHQFR